MSPNTLIIYAKFLVDSSQLNLHSEGANATLICPQFHIWAICIFSTAGIAADPEKTQVIKKWPTPRWYPRNFANIVAP